MDLPKSGDATSRLPRRRYRQILGLCGHVAKFADGLCPYFDARFHFDTFLSGQATDSYFERHTFGFVSHEASPGAYLAAAAAYNLSTLLAIG